MWQQKMKEIFWESDKNLNHKDKIADIQNGDAVIIKGESKVEDTGS